MPLTDPAAGRQTGGPAPLTITDLQCHAGLGWEGGVDQCENVVLRQFLVCERCGVCDGSGVIFNAGCMPSRWCSTVAVSYIACMVWFGWWRGRGARLLTVAAVGVVGGEHRSAPPLASAWCVVVFWYVVRLVVLVGGEQGSAPLSPLCSRRRMMCVISPITHRGRGLREVVLLCRTVVCQGRGAGLRTAVMLFFVLSVVSGGWLSLSRRGAVLRTAVCEPFGREANLARTGASSSIRSRSVLGPEWRATAAELNSMAGGSSS